MWFTSAVSLLLCLAGLGSVPARAAEEKGVIPIKEVFQPDGTWPKNKYAKVAVLQWNQHDSTPVKVSKTEAETFKQRNREVIANFVRVAAQNGAELVVTPEFSIVGYPNHPGVPPEEDNFMNREEVEPYTETVPGPSTKFFAAVAKETKTLIHIGIVEVDKTTNLYYNTVVAISPEGKILAKYRKIHLFGGESKYLAAGDTPVIYNGVGGRTGIIICSDVYSAFPMNNYKNKIDVMALSTSWAAWNSGMAAYQAGAKWVNVPLLAANQTYFPDSGVVNADGTCQSHIRQSAGLAYGYVLRKKK